MRLGTTVLVLPMRHPLRLAKELATLQNFSEGRLILGAGSGWLKEEFAALGVPFEERGRRLDEGIAMMRAFWSEDPVSFQSRYIPAVIEGMTMTPVPLWFGGSAEPALRWTIRIGDGWHGSGLTAEQAAPIVARLRAARPGADFTVSMRVQWDGTDRGCCGRWWMGLRRSGWIICWWRRRIGMWTIGRRLRRGVGGWWGRLAAARTSL